MATVAATVEASPPFEPGTSVKLWRADVFPGGGAQYNVPPPPGATPIATVVVPPSGDVTFTGLEPVTRYVTGAQVEELFPGSNPSIKQTWRYISFISIPAPTGGGGGGEGKEGPAGPAGSTGAKGEFNFIPGAWVIGAEYKKGDAVPEAGSTYASLKDGNVGHKPSLEGEWWAVIAAKGAAGGGGGSAAQPFVDITKFTYEGIEYAYTEAMSLAGEDGSAIMQKAIERAVQLGGATVSTSQPWNQVWLEKLQVPTYANAFKTLLEGRKASEMHAGFHLHGGAKLKNIKVKMGGKATTEVETLRLGEERSMAYVFTVDRGYGFRDVILDNVEYSASGNIAHWNENKNLLTENVFVDGFHAGSKGIYDNVNGSGQLRFGKVEACNHATFQNCTFGGVYKIGYLNYASGGARTGNTAHSDCNLQGGGGFIFVDSGCAVTGMYFERGWYGFGGKLPWIYKPVTGTKSVMIGSLKMINPQIEGGHGPLLYSEDGGSRVVNFSMIGAQIGGSDPLMGGPGPSDTRLGYSSTNAAVKGHAVDAFIKCSKMHNTQIPLGALLTVSGWGIESAVVIAGAANEGSMTECDLGDCSVVLDAIQFRGKPFVITKEVAGVKMRLANKNGEVANVILAYSNVPLTEGQIVRYTTSNKQDYAVTPMNQEGGAMAGIAFMSISAGQWAPIVTKSPDRPYLMDVPIALLGAGEGESGVVPPLSRGGESTLAAAFTNGSGVYAGHTAPTVLWGVSAWRDSVFLDTLADLSTSEATVSVNGKNILTYREAFDKGHTRTVSLKLTKGEELAKINSGGVTGLTPGLFIKGPGIPKGTIIEVVDPANNTLLLSNTASLNEAAASCTAETTTAVLMGAVPGSATHSTLQASTTEMAGSGTLKVERTTGFPASGSFQMMRAWEPNSAKLTFSYTSKDATSFKGVTYTGPGTKTLWAGMVVSTLSPPKAGNKARILRAMQVASIGGETVLYNGSEVTLSTSTPQSIKFNELTSFPASGLAVFTAESTLAQKSIEKGDNQKIKVASTATFPLTGGKLELGKDATLTYGEGGILNSTEVEGSMKVAQAHRTRVEGEKVVLMHPVEVSYKKRSSTELEEAVAVSGADSHAVRKGMTITAVLFNPSGGIVEATASGQRYQYKNALEAREKKWIVGVATPERGSNLAEGAAIKNLTVLPITVSGQGFAVGPASAQVYASKEAAFPYEEFIGVSAVASEVETGEGEEVEGEGEEEGEVEEEEVAAEAGTPGYFIGLGEVEGNGAGSAGSYSGGALLRTAVKLTEDTTILATDVRSFPSRGNLKVKNTTAHYTSVATAESSRTGKVKSGAKSITGVSSLTNVVPGIPLLGNGLTGLQVVSAAAGTIVLNGIIKDLTLTVSGTAKSGQNKVKISNSESIVIEAGLEVFGTGIPLGTTIKAKISASEIELSVNLTEDLTTSMLVHSEIASETFQVLLGEFKGVTWAEGTEKVEQAAGRPVTLAPGQNTTVDQPVRAAFGASGRSGTGDVGVVYTPSSSAEGAVVGVAVGEDTGSVVPVVVA